MRVEQNGIGVDLAKVREIEQQRDQAYATARDDIADWLRRSGFEEAASAVAERPLPPSTPRNYGVLIATLTNIAWHATDVDCGRCAEQMCWEANDALSEFMGTKNWTGDDIAKVMEAHSVAP